jgi:single-strand DNA-binding protein
VSLNKVMIIGNLGRDPEMRYTQGGQAVTQFSVAASRNYKNPAGEWQEETEWFRVVAWGALGERTAEYLRKGRKVYVEGRLQTRQWEGQDGQKRYTTEVIAQTVTPLDPKPRDAGEGSFDAGAPRGAAPAAPAGSPDAGFDEIDDLPF